VAGSSTTLKPIPEMGPSGIGVGAAEGVTAGGGAGLGGRWADEMATPATAATAITATRTGADLIVAVCASTSILVVIERLPLTAPLSQALVAFTIEFDNEADHRMPHYRVTRGASGTRDGPWLVSMVMWFNCMRHVGEESITVGELERRARTRTNLPGMRRWGYVDVEPDRDDMRAKPPSEALLVRATADGRMARRVWEPLVPVIEARWAERWGSAQVGAVRTALRALVKQSPFDLPDCLPILGYGNWTAGRSRAPFAPAGLAAVEEPEPSLPSLLARALLMIAIDFEARSKVSLANFANVLRVLDEQPVPVRDLPIRSGVSKEAISMALGVLVKRGLAVINQNATGRPGKVVRLTTKGTSSQGMHARLLRAVEEDLESRFGAGVIGAVRESLTPLAGDSRGSGLFPALNPYPEGWRASVRKPETLPQFPMVLHRGGYPDGS
jgi:DNA-binding MarR family transcriptional regulator